MIRQSEREQLNRLTVKTLDQVFIMRAKEGLGCSQFEAEALTASATTPTTLGNPTVLNIIHRKAANTIGLLPVKGLSPQLSERSFLRRVCNNQSKPNRYCTSCHIAG
jgi:hypothetical protein